MEQLTVQDLILMFRYEFLEMKKPLQHKLVELE